jgi:hypothetical protein
MVGALRIGGIRNGWVVGRGAFIDSMLDAIDSFYLEVIQNLKPWMPAPPKLRSTENSIEMEPVPPALSSTAISSQDGPEPAEGARPVEANDAEEVFAQHEAPASQVAS